MENNKWFADIFNLPPIIAAGYRRSDSMWRTRWAGERQTHRGETSVKVLQGSLQTSTVGCSCVSLSTQRVFESTRVPSMDSKKWPSSRLIIYIIPNFQSLASFIWESTWWIIQQILQISRKTWRSCSVVCHQTLASCSNWGFVTTRSVMIRTFHITGSDQSYHDYHYCWGILEMFLKNQNTLTNTEII